MTPFEALTQEEQEKITDYIAEYGDEYRSPKNSVPLSHILRFWDSAKSDLFSLFGDKLILKYPITYAQPEEDIIQECIEDPELGTLLSGLKKAFRSFDPTTDQYEYSSLFYLNRLIPPKSSSANDLPYYVRYNGKEYKVSPNTKSIRILGKMARDTKDPGILDLYEKLRIVLSQHTNQKELHGNLCLSIHPLDYMTMSDNDSGWDSCMSWVNQGDYRAGTVEMMNSPCVVVAYVESEHKQTTFANSTITWNNKKWRELFLVTPNLITEIKPYPYDNEFFTKETLRRLGALQPEANFSDAFKMPVRKTFIHKDKELVFRPQATYMYNDFGLTTSNKHWAIINEDNLDSWQTHINYSGAMNCMSCGEEIEYNIDYSNEVFCAPCLGETTFVCDCCGRTVRNSNETNYWVQNRLICEDCYENQVMYDPILGEDAFDSDTYLLYLVIKDEKGKEHHSTWDYIWTTIDSFHDDYRFNIDKPHYDSSKDIYYVCPEDFTDKRFGKELFREFPN